MMPNMYKSFLSFDKIISFFKDLLCQRHSPVLIQDAFYENENCYFRSIKFYKVEVKLVHLTYAEKKILSYLRN